MNTTTRRAIEHALTHRYRLWRIELEYGVTREQVREIKRAMKWRAPIYLTHQKVHDDAERH